MNQVALPKGSEMAFNHPSLPPNPTVVINVNKSFLRAPLLHEQTGLHSLEH